MTDMTRLLTSLVGILIGGGVGGGLFYLLNRYYEKAVNMPGLSLVALVVLIGGGVLGGGALALWLTTKAQRARKAKLRGRRDAKKYQPKKKGKK